MRGFLRSRAIPAVLFFLISLFVFQNHAKASHAVGIDLTYQCLGGNQYQFTVNFYRDCEGISAPSSAFISISSASCGITTSTSLARIGVLEVSAICPSQLGSTSCSGGNLPGIQQYTYRGTFTLPANCNDWVIGYTECCRNAAITNLQNPGSQNLYVEALLSNAGGLCNNSPFFTSLPTPYLCAGQPFFYNHGAIDIDGDSLVYTLVQPRTARPSNIPYNGGFTPTSPMTTTSGFNFNNATGQMSFTPSNPQQAVVTVMVSEYRNGVLIGSVVRDLQLVVINCSNQLPTASGINGTNGVGGAYNLSVCAGFPLCFDISSIDLNAGQLVTMAWNGGIQGATFTSTGTPFPRATFCWTPTPADIGTHNFSLEVRDNACPIPGLNIYTYTINVTPNPNPPVVANPDRIICQGGSTNLTATTAATGVTYAWSPSTGLSCTNCANPTASPSLTTVYTVTANYPDGCSGSDDVRVTVNPTPTVSVFPAAATICTGGAITLTASGSAGVASYTWNPGNLSGSSVIVSPSATTTYTVTAFDATGCPSLPATSVITLNPPPAAPVCNNIYVTTVGGGTGLSPSSPTTLLNALTIGACNSVNIKMAIGTYQIDNAITNFTSYMTIEGGFDPGNSWRKTSLAGATTILRTSNNPDGPPNAPRIVAFYLNTAQYFRFQDLTIRTQDAPDGNVSNYVMHLTSCSNYEIVRTRLICGAGGSGIPGNPGFANVANGTPGTNGLDGQPDDEGGAGAGGNGGQGGGAGGGVGGPGGQDTNGPGGCCQNGPPGQAGGAGSSSGQGGGGGGGATGGEVDRTAGTGGAGGAAFGGAPGPAGGVGGAGDDPGRPGAFGQPGANGGNGTNGANGAAGSFAGGFFIPGGAGANGTNGTGGGGGSGGGGGGGHYCTILGVPSCDFGAGNGGGGGGGGGQGGYGGEGGTQGGASIALYLFNNGANGNIRDCNVAPGAAGTGALGGNGSNGGFGGAGGIGATRELSEIGAGGNGGFGGSGGRGGNGGRGADGVSFQVYVDGGTAPTTTSYNFNLVAQPVITATNISCTLTDITYAAGSSSAWTYGTGAVPTSGSGATVVTQYTTTGRKNLTYGANSYLGFANIAISNAAFVPDIIVQGATQVNATTYRICVGSPVNFRTSSLAVGYEWNMTGLLPSNYTTQNVLGAVYQNPGTFPVTLRVNTDCCGLSQTTTITMIVDPAPNLSFAGTRNYCEGGSTTITASGAATYVWTPNTGISSTSAASVTITTQTTTTYIVYGYNAGGTCQDVDSITITVNPNPNLSTSAVAATCGSNGSVSVTVAPTGTYTYQWNTVPPRSTPTASNVPQGNYQIVVVNPATGCRDTAYQAVAANGTPIAYITGVQNITCNGANNGLAQAAVTGGTPGYTYSWGPGLTSANRTGLTPGTHTVTVTDANGCTSSATAFINQPTPITAVITATPATCANTNDGLVSVVPDGGAGNYQLQWSTNPVQTNDTVFNAAAGAYTVTVTDANGCTLTRSAAISSPPPFVISQTLFTNTTCGGTNGAITINAIGGTGTKTYALDGATAQATGAFTNVPPGPHTILITDANGCDSLYAFNFTTPPPFSFTTTVTPIGCSGGTTGTIVANGVGGTGTLQYRIGLLPYGANNNFTALPAGTYIVWVRDGVGCTLSDTVILAAPGSLNVALVQDSASCNGVADGGITATGSGGTSPYRFSLSGGPALQTSGVFSPLAANNYTVTITDNFGCTASASVTVRQPAVLTVNLVQDSVDCNGASDGSITATGVGGTAPYQYSINGGTNYQPSGLFPGLSAGPQTITIRDANNCTGTANITVRQPNVLTMNPVVTDLDCPTDPTGVIATNPSGGSAPYRASLNGGAFVTPPTFTGLSVGTYNIIVRDAKGCEVAQTITVGAPSGVTLTLTAVNVSCTGANGSITAVGAGGVPGYFYQINGGPLVASGVFNNLPAATYVIRVFDGGGCFALDSIQVLPTQPIPLTLVVDSALCFGGNTGTINATVNGGTAGYTFNINGGAYSATNIFPNLVAGPYTIGVRDGSGCAATAVGTVLQPSAVVVNSVIVDSVSCFGGSDGTVIFDVAGGSGTYEYSLGSGYQPSSVFLGVPAGNYANAAVRDSRGCSVSRPVIVAQPAALTVSAVQDSANCNGASDGTITVTAGGGSNGYEYSRDGSVFQPSPLFTGVPAGVYTITVRDINLCTQTTTVTVREPAPINVSLAAGGSNCGGAGSGQIVATAGGGNGIYQYDLNNSGTYQVSNTFTGLNPGNYTVRVRDQNNCIASAIINVTQPALLTATAVQDSVNCNGASDGEINVFANGGLAPYEYSINGVTFQTSNSFTGLAAGPYTLTVEDVNNCTATTTITVLAPAALTLALVQDSVECFGASDGSITVTAGGGSSGYEYSIDGVAFQTSNVFPNLAAGNYTITVEDFNNCQATGTINVLQPADLGATTTVVDISCGGGSNGEITVTATGGSSPYVYDLNGGTAQASNVFTGLAANTYTINIVDNNGCNESVTATVQNAITISVSLVADSVNCNGGADGQITVTATGGAIPLEYSNNGGTSWQPSNVFNGLTAGPYTITVRDASLCTNTATITVREPLALSLTGVQDSVECNGNADGSITLTATGGSLPYSYTLNGGVAQPSNVFGGLSANNYNLAVTDLYGCPATVAVSVLQPTALTISVAPDPASCAGGVGGGIEITAGGGSPAYQYSIDGTNFQANNIFTGMPAGPYTATVRDGNGCTITATGNIVQPVALTLTVAQDSVECNGGADGSITATAGGGTGVFEFRNGGAYQPSNTFGNLTAGPYTITVRDGNGCTITASTTVLQPAALSVTGTAIDISCNSNNDGQINAAAVGGSLPYEYRINSGAYQASSNFANLTANTYTLDVRDGNGCTATTTVTVQPAAVVTLTLTQDSVNCNGGNDGQVIAVGSGGSGALQYSIDGGATFQPSGTFTGLTVNNYTIRVEDIAGCFATASINVLQPTALGITVVQDSANCFGAADGFITATATGASLPYEYSRNATTYAPSNVIGSLAAGPYTITVRDRNGCTANANATVLQPTALTTNVTGTNVSCANGTNGSATVVAGGGSLPYNYSWNAGGGINATSPNRASGWAVVTVTDLRSCTRRDSVLITQPTALAITETVVPITCASGNTGSINLVISGGTGPSVCTWPGISQTGTSLTNLGSGTYTVVVTDANSCTATETYTINPPGNVTLTPTTTGVSCYNTPTGSATVSVQGATGAVTYQWNSTPAQSTATASNLPAGPYGVTVTDATGCSATATVNVANAPEFIATVAGVDPRCFDTTDGSVTVSATGGTGVITYTWSHSNTLNTSDATGLNQGSYSVTVTDANNCSVTLNETLTSPSQLFVSLTASADTVKFGESVQLEATPGSGVIGTPIYEWTPSENLSCVECADPEAGPLTEAVQVFTVRIADDQGCDAEAQVRVIVDLYDRVLYVPNAFTPNGDGLNDVFQVYGYGFDEVLFQVFDRWGEKMFETTDPTVGWDGTFKGTAMPPGVYVFQVKAMYLDGQEGYKKGSVTILK